MGRTTLNSRVIVIISTLLSWYCLFARL